MLRTITVLAFLGLAACSKSSSSGGTPSCDDAVTSASKKLGLPDEEVADMKKECVDEKWTDKERTCVKAAPDFGGMMECFTGRMGDGE